MKKLFALILIMLIFSVAPACADDCAPHPMEVLDAKQGRKAQNALDATTWYLHHRQYDPHLENGICVENCDGVVEVAKSVPDSVAVPVVVSVPDSVAVPVVVSVPDSVAVPPPPHKFYYGPGSSHGSGITDMLAGAKCITIPPSGCDAIWTVKRHAKKAAYHAPICR
jgi:hypothetical protein